MTIVLISASIMGTADGVANALAAHLIDLGIQVTRSSTLDPWLADSESRLLVITSNTGAGDLPSPANTIHTELVTNYPRIGGRRFAVVNLGDSSYMTFGEAGQKLYDAFMDLGAEPFADMLTLDACSGEDPVQLTIQWWDEHTQ
jgi:MioC protein